MQLEDIFRNEPATCALTFSPALDASGVSPTTKKKILLLLDGWMSTPPIER
jgi:hypothetical protein